MKRIITLILQVCICTAIWAVPANRSWLQALLETGDTARYEAMLRHERATNHLHPTHPLFGKAESIRRVGSQNMAPRGLLILINFSDIQFQTSNSQAEMDSMLNAQSYTFGQSYGSARKYFYDQSGGQYEPHFDVVGPFTLPHPASYYGTNNSQEQDSRLGDFVLHACSMANQAGVNFSQYDNNRDGYLDFVYIIYAGHNEAEGADETTLWPASWDMKSAIQEGYTSLPTNARTGQYSYGGKIIGSFAYSSELRGATGHQRAGIGTFCHEFSHVLGLPDYYDTFYGTNSKQRKTPEGWSLMDHGSYNVNGQVPAAYSIHDKWFLGWAEPTLLCASQHIDMSADGETTFYVNARGTAATATTETLTYFLENRQQTGWDQGLPGSGLLIWRVLYNQAYWDNNEPNSSYDQKNTQANIAGDISYSILSATGMSTNIGSAADTYPGSNQVTSCSLFDDQELTNITETGAVVSFDYARTGSEATALDETIATEQSSMIYLNGQLIIRKGDKLYTLLGQQIQR